MAKKKSKEVKLKKEKTNKITIDKADLPKTRDPYRVSIIERKKGAHESIKKEADKKKCRKKVSKDDDV